MTSGGQILWNAITICELSNISWQTGLRMNEDLENHLKDPLFHFVHWWNISQTPRIFVGYALIAEGIRKGDILIADIEE